MHLLASIGTESTLWLLKLHCWTILFFPSCSALFFISRMWVLPCLIYFYCWLYLFVPTGTLHSMFPLMFIITIVLSMGKLSFHPSCSLDTVVLADRTKTDIKALERHHPVAHWCLSHCTIIWSQMWSLIWFPMCLQFYLVLFYSFKVDCKLVWGSLWA